MKLFPKILIVSLIIAIIPIGGTVFYFVTMLNEVGDFSVDTSRSALTQQAQDFFTLEAQRIAEKIESYLHEREADAVYTASIFSHVNDTAPYRDQLLAFQENTNSSLWLNNGTEINPESVNIITYLYPDIAVTNASGYEIIHLVNGSDATLRNVSIGPNTDYLNESYFNDTKNLLEGECHVTQLETWYINRTEIFGEPPLDPDYNNFSIVPGLDFMKTGYIRFCAPIYNNSVFQGIVVLSLDYLHFRELTKHIEPSSTESVISSTYTGNYVLIFNDEGTTIVHPKPNNIRGRLSDGSLAPYQVKGVTSKTGNFAFNYYAYSDDYQEIAQIVLDEKGDHARTTTDVSGRVKMTISVPITFNVSGYTSKGVFGGVFISISFETFYDLVDTINENINTVINNAYINAIIFTSLVAIAVVIVVFVLMKGMTRPMIDLTQFADKVSRGEESEIIQSNRTDEIGKLYRSINRMIGILAAARYITEQKKAEEILKKSQEMLDNIFSNLKDTIFVISKEYEIMFMNQNALEQFEEDYVGRECYNALFGINQPCEGCPIETVIKGGMYQNRIEKTITLPSTNQISHFDVNVSLIENFKGKPAIIVAFRDVTKQREAEQELKDTQAELVKKERLAVLGKLAGGVGHELRNPLGSIKNAAYFLNMVLEDLDPQVKESLQIIEEEVNSSEKIINDLLGYARPKPPNIRKVKINSIIQEVLSYTTIPENVEVINRLDATLPSILADPDQLKQVFGNIILNAIQAMPEGGQLFVKTEVQSQEEITISFTDTGVGISEEDLSKPFEPLYTTKAKGIGLGLAICKTIIEKHKGIIEVKSEIKKGSTFSIKLPFGKKG